MHIGGGGRGGGVAAPPMRKSFKDSLKVLEADIQHANTLASDFPREYDGAYLQMRMSYSPAAPLFLFLVQWTDCHLAGALGLLRIMVYEVYVDHKTTTMSSHERKASIREFYAILYPSLLQLQKGGAVSDSTYNKKHNVCGERYKRRDDDEDQRLISDTDSDREEECGICTEMNSRIVLPNCNHAICMRCYCEWRSRSESCPFCRDSLTRVSSGDLWVLIDQKDAVDISTINNENLRRLFMYIDKLPLKTPDNPFDSYDEHLR